MKIFKAKKYQSKLRETAEFLRKKLGPAPPWALILGSGLGDFVDDLSDKKRIPYSKIPNFPVSTVVGHSGALTLVEGPGPAFCAMQGRVHLYEGWPARVVVFPVRALALWGVSRFVITNAAGAVNSSFRVGELMLISDHLNLLGDNPLSGPNLRRLGERFPDMTHAYDPEARSIARQICQELGIGVREGVYAAVKGPSYETPAEIRMLRTMGADAVGMSTVPEVIALNHMGRSVLGVSCLTNMAAGIQDEPMKHEDVLATTAAVKEGFARLILKFLERTGS